MKISIYRIRRGWMVVINTVRHPCKTLTEALDHLPDNLPVTRWAVEQSCVHHGRFDLEMKR